MTTANPLFIPYVDNNTPGSANFGIAPTPTPIPKYSISGNVYLDADSNQHYTTPPDSLYASGRSGISVSGPISLSMTTANGVYATGAKLPAGTYTVSYTSLPTGYYLTYPRTGPPPSFSVTVGPGCRTNGVHDASCNGSNAITGLDFGITNSIPWIQLIDFDGREDTGFKNTIPATPAPACGAYAAIKDTSASNPGQIFTRDTSADFGQGQASTTNQVVGGTQYPEVFSPPTGAPIHTSSAYLSAKAKTAGISPTDFATLPGCMNLSDCTLPANLPNGVYQATGGLSLHAYTFPASKNFIFLMQQNTLSQEVAP